MCLRKLNWGSNQFFFKSWFVQFDSNIRKLKVCVSLSVYQCACMRVVICICVCVCVCECVVMVCAFGENQITELGQ